MTIDWLEEARAWFTDEPGGLVLVVFDSEERRQLYWQALMDTLPAEDVLHVRGTFEALGLARLADARIRALATQNPFNLPHIDRADGRVLVIGIGELDPGMLEALCDIASAPDCRLIRVRPTTARVQLTFDVLANLMGFPPGVLLKSLRQLTPWTIEVEFNGLPVSGPVSVTLNGQPGTGSQIVEVAEVGEDGKPGRRWKREEPKPAAAAQPAPAPPQGPKSKA